MVKYIVNLNITNLPMHGLIATRLPQVIAYERTDQTAWKELGKTEVAPNPVNPRFIKYFVFDDRHINTTHLKFEIVSVDTKNLFKGKKTLGETRVSLRGVIELAMAENARDDAEAFKYPSIFAAEAPKGPEELRAEDPVELAPQVHVLAQEINFIQQSNLWFDVLIHGLGLHSSGLRYVLSRLYKWNTNVKIPLYASEIHAGKGAFQRANIPSVVLVDGLNTYLHLAVFDVNNDGRTGKKVGEIVAPILALLEIDVNDKRPMWHDDIHVTVTEGQLRLTQNHIDANIIHLQFAVNYFAGELRQDRAIARRISNQLSKPLGVVRKSAAEPKQIGAGAQLHEPPVPAVSRSHSTHLSESSARVPPSAQGSSAASPRGYTGPGVE
ncbi:Copine-9 [Porphyridium purpureum]|uniref:Copine-9 n=1 Tax=Porphyridium purpureum TaxID=35688 RepID=A0A5J4YJ65_PORPP|nr:Copine-9 [Porphyridium purpureum]|eukprot:POR2363..scf251_18